MPPPDFKTNDMNKTHRLKTWPPYFEEVFAGRKTFEVRENDRDFKAGDTVILEEWDNEKEEYTGRDITKIVPYVLQGGAFGVESGYVVLSLA